MKNNQIRFDLRNRLFEQDPILRLALPRLRVDTYEERFVRSDGGESVQCVLRCHFGCFVAEEVVSDDGDFEQLANDEFDSLLNLVGWMSEEARRQN